MAYNEEKQLLQQITYLSRLINRHKNANSLAASFKKTPPRGNQKSQPHFERYASNKVYIRRPTGNDKVSLINETQNKKWSSRMQHTTHPNMQTVNTSEFSKSTNDTKTPVVNTNSCSILKTETLSVPGSSTILVNPQFASNKILINPHFKSSEEHKNNDAVKTRQKLIRGNLLSPTKNLKYNKKIQKSCTQSNQLKYLHLNQPLNSVMPINNKKFVRKAQVVTVTNDQVKLLTENKASGPLISIKNNKKLVRQSKLIEEQNSKNKNTLVPAIKKKFLAINSVSKCRHSPKKSIPSQKQLKLDHRKKKKQQEALRLTQNNRSQFKLDHRNKLKTELPATTVVKKRSFVSQAKQKSISTLRKKLRKNNKPCVFYRRFGKCTRPLCSSVHDPKQISLCKKFLMGKCELTGCLLSHEVVPEKMPTCEYFLAGCCNRISCPYLHVKVNPTAEICVKFLSGYCDNGSSCKKRHVNICPEFEKTGSCKLGKTCMHPHKTVDLKKSEKYAAIGDNSKSITDTKMEKKIYKIKNNTKRKVEDIDQVSSSVAESRYFQGSSQSNPESKESVFVPAPKREKLGKLPAFIPL